MFSSSSTVARLTTWLLAPVVTAVALHMLVVLRANAAQGEPQWRSTTYAIPATRGSVGSVLRDLARAVGMGVDVTSRAAAVPIALEAQPPAGIVGFLDSLSQRHRLDWFVFRGTLHASLASEAKEMQLDVPQARQAELKVYLENLKLLDDRFTWLPMASSNIILVMGPPGYLRLVQQHAQRLLEMGDPLAMSTKGRPVMPASEEVRIMVFRLRHATAVDRAPNDPDGDGLTTQLGVATHLSMLMGITPTPLQGTLEAGRKQSLLRQNDSLQRIAGETDEPLAAEIRSQAAMAVAQTDLAAFGRVGGAGRIIADPRTNSILVRDKPSLRPQYEQLIAALDFPQPMLGLDALVLELPAGRARALLASTPGSVASASLSSSARVLSVPHALNLLQRAADLRVIDPTVDMATHGIVFRQGSAISLDFRDAKLFPQYSVPIWDRLLRQVFRLPEGQDQVERVMTLKITGSARMQDNGRIGLQMDVSEDRVDPLMSDKTIDQRSTRLRAGADVQDDEVLVMVASTHAMGRENRQDARARLILLSARCMGCDSRSGY